MKLLNAAWITALVLLGPTPAAADPMAHIDELRSVPDGISIDVAVAGLSLSDFSDPRAVVTVGDRNLDATTLVRDRSGAQVEESRSLVFAIDVSGSMAEGNLYAAKLAALQFIDELPAAVQIGVVSFGDSARIVSPLTSDRQALRRAITKLKPGGDTALYDGVLSALQALGSGGRRNLILLTDGEDTSSRGLSVAAVSAVRSSGVRVDAIQFATGQGTNEFLNAMVAAGLGQLFAASDAETLLSVFRQTTQTGSADVSVFVRNIPPDLSGRQSIKIELQFGAQKALVVGTVDLPSLSSARAGGTGTPPLLLGLSAVLAGSVFSLLLALLAGSRRARRRRIEQVIAIRNQMLGMEPDAGSEDRTLIESLEELVKPWIRRAGVEQKWTLMLDGAGLMLTAEQWLLVRVAAVLVPMLTAAGLFPTSFSLLFISGVSGYFAPRFLLNQRRKMRAREFEAALPDMLLLVASSLRSGFSLEQAIVTAADQSDGPAAQQMKRATQELRIGLPLEVALGRVAERMASRDFGWVVSALQIQRKSGGNLSELLSTAAKTVRERAEIRREVLTLTAEGRLSANVMMIMPFGLLGFMLVTQPGYVEPLWTTDMGRLMSTVAAIMLALGWVAMRELVQVEA